MSSPSISTPTFERFRPHPWYGLSPGRQPPLFVQVFVETTPFDAVKYEVDKANGYLRVNRLQRTSSLPPALYGFIPQTLCGERVGALTPDAKGGDGDPLDICVFSERPIRAVEVVLDVRVLGGLRTLDAGEADDKIVAVLENDPLWVRRGRWLTYRPCSSSGWSITSARTKPSGTSRQASMCSRATARTRRRRSSTPPLLTIVRISLRQIRWSQSRGSKSNVNLAADS